MNEIKRAEVKNLLNQALENRPLISKENSTQKRRKYDIFKLVNKKILIITILIISVVIIYFNNTKNKTITFETLDKTIQVNYISISKYNDILEKYNKLKNKKVIETKKIVEAKKEKINSITNKQTNIINTAYDKYENITCYDSKKASKYLSSNCKNNVKSFLENNHTYSKRYQIIALLDDKDYKEISNIKSKSYKEYLKLGLGKARVLEAAWLIKSKLGKDNTITYVNYLAYSKKGRGIIIRAYK